MILDPSGYETCSDHNDYLCISFHFIIIFTEWKDS